MDIDPELPYSGSSTILVTLSRPVTTQEVFENLTLQVGNTIVSPASAGEGVITFESAGGVTILATVEEDTITLADTEGYPYQVKNAWWGGADIISVNPELPFTGQSSALVLQMSRPLSVSETAVNLVLKTTGGLELTPRISGSYIFYEQGGRPLYQVTPLNTGYIRITPQSSASTNPITEVIYTDAAPVLVYPITYRVYNGKKYLCDGDGKLLNTGVYFFRCDDDESGWYNIEDNNELAVVSEAFGGYTYCLYRPVFYNAFIVTLNDGEFTFVDGEPRFELHSFVS